ncbi:hypothetical protein [Paracoccus sp. (in: a-proteobacteria)]|uniref:hypothetical protein n=1 Tax=Paracoccus sp. TaxID=267 RepID=UPI0034CDC5BA
MSLLPADLTPKTALHPDCAMYRRHVENGESIRALAREAGCHPSTMMRRIRRFESRRDDPLVDAALDRPASAADQRQLQRILRRLAEPGAVLAVAAGMDKAIVSRDEMRTAILDATLAEHLALQGWVELIGQGRIARYVLTASGRAALRAMLGGGWPGAAGG